MCKSVSGIYKININNKCYIGSAVSIKLGVSNKPINGCLKGHTKSSYGNIWKM